jgi:hypothetical protein
MSTRRLQPDEAWDALEKMALDDEAERVGALSDEEIDAELASEGLDPKALRARGAALAAKLKAAVPAPVVELGVKARLPARKRWVALLAAATLAAVALAVAVPTVVIIAERRGLWPGDTMVSAPPRKDAAELRRDALIACHEQRWHDCLRGLDEARGLDPKGEESQDVKDARREIEDALGPPKHP